MVVVKGNWNGASIVTDEKVQWAWNHWTDAPTIANNWSADGECLERDTVQSQSLSWLYGHR